MYRPPLTAALAAAAIASACSPGAGGSSSAASSPLAGAIRNLRRSVTGSDRWAPAASATRLVRHATSTVAAGLRHLSPDSVPASVTADSTLSSTPVIRMTTTIAEARTIWLGDTLDLAAPAPPVGTPAEMASDVRWSSSEPDVAMVSSDGRVVATGAGEASIRIWRAVGETVAPLVVLPAVRGRVVAADGAGLRARVVVRTASRADTVESSAGGRFAFRPTAPFESPLTVHVDALDSAAEYAPAVVRDLPSARLGALDVVLLPATWRLTAGTYAGSAVPISAAIAQVRVGDGRRIWNLARLDHGTVRRGGPAVGWAPERFPLTVAFDHERVAIGEGDSVRFWRAARQLERDWGAPLFRPVTVDAAAARAGGAADIDVTIDSRIRVAGLTTIGWNGDGEISESVLAFSGRDIFSAPGIITHELLHALGIGHADDEWHSVMHPTSDGSVRASAEDIAYGQLLYAVRARTRPALGRVPVGIAEAAAAAVIP
jgi:hypothetical protein